MIQEYFDSEMDLVYKYFLNEIHMHIKFKTDKWIKMISNEDYKVRLI